MSDEIIRIRNASYAKYEEVLTRRDEVRKEAFQYENAYIREFGDLILKVFQKKMECIRKRKTIDYCQVFLNRGESVDQNALQDYLDRELAAYREKLEQMIRDNETAKDFQSIAQSDLLKIKRIYRRLVKKIHPDINPLTNENEELKGLWQRLIIAYECNALHEMEETEVLINALLERLNLGTMEITIPGIEERIAEVEEEIERIISTDPYRYRELLEDPKAISEKRTELEEELQEFEEYEKQLDEILDGLLLRGVNLTWRMN